MIYLSVMTRNHPRKLHEDGILMSLFPVTSYLIQTGERRLNHLNNSSTEASMDPPNVAIMFTWSSCFMLTCRGITRHDDMKYVNMTT